MSHGITESFTLAKSDALICRKPRNTILICFYKRLKRAKGYGKFRVIAEELENLIIFLFRKKQNSGYA